MSNKPKPIDMTLESNAFNEQIHPHDRENMGYSWIYLLGEKGNPCKTKIGLTTKENPLRRFKEMATGNTNLYFYLAYRLPAWYASSIAFEEETWHQFFDDPSCTTTSKSGKAKGKQALSISDFFQKLPVDQRTNFDRVKDAKRLTRWDGGSSEWFSVKPKDAAAVITEYIGETKASMYVNYEMHCNRNKGDYYDQPIAANECIYYYTEAALNAELGNGKTTIQQSKQPSMPIELCSLLPNQLESLPPLAPPTAEDADIKASRECLVNWLEELENAESDKDEYQVGGGGREGHHLAGQYDDHTGPGGGG